MHNHKYQSRQEIYIFKDEWIHTKNISKDQRLMHAEFVVRCSMLNFWQFQRTALEIEESDDERGGTRIRLSWGLINTTRGWICNLIPRDESGLDTSIKELQTNATIIKGCSQTLCSAVHLQTAATNVSLNNAIGYGIQIDAPRGWQLPAKINVSDRTK